MDPVLPDRDGEGASREGASEGAAFRAVAQSSRRTPAAIAVAAIGVLAFALLTKQPAFATSVPTSSVQPRQSAAAAVRPAASPSAVARMVVSDLSPISDVPSRNPTVTPHPTFLAVPAEAGTTRIIPAGPTPVRLKVSLPHGWQKASDAMYVKANGVAPAGLSIGAWQLQHVNIVPCRWSSQEFADPPLMRTAEGQAEALSEWWGQDPGMLPYWNSKIAPLAGKRIKTTIGGYPAWYVEVLIPSYLDHAECDGGQVVLWDTANGDVRYSLGPGELNRLFVVDVDGELIVIDAASFLGTSKADLAELQAVIDSVVIEP